ncbi:uncharacterized protein LOC112464158 [Temnothorax curvispinosus]|uniref:Uncharacterized protein LOC112462304 n=1 Tax=Temnothorax curvispinosus TaxID=300111 RepID=A0A6J1R1T9_9HYME|nr:uncharacterized protein LOC112462304 [Temnothorax curvispinosus]XP_024883781.1 uncharacterized protein LOC112462304 [Temnothorax curvispinosus]XP_024883783.1 uncharacterized protein LOC112462304 [Temnothorax curvispinosus]XP_024886764.1 uncharacterized protein LOC112464158 [Temnothorax curvispinosus]XP_024886765.1 uncharacterized protein LOC112464158 [Temnothorax curvispinosus]XP_024886767.1 uncharacterized protein LOC112464158 [Temnothorax curvispinosus]
MILPPFEFLVNCGKITYSLSNIYLKRYKYISCFDITITAIALGNAQNLNAIPSEKDFKIYMIETNHGDPHPDTGIPPSFATIKSEMILGKNRQFFIEMGRPTKVHFSLSRLNQLYNIRNKVLSCFIDDDVQVPTEKNETTDMDSQNIAVPTKSRKFSVPDLHLNTRQVVLSLKTDTGAEIITSLASLNGNLSTLLRLDRIYSNLSIDSFIVSAILNGNIKVLLNPWCCNFVCGFLYVTFAHSDQNGS